jgi:predicted dehydrogenase
MKRRDFLPTAASVCTVLATSSTAAQSKQRIRLGQIGVAHGHASKISVYRQSTDYEVVGIVEPNDQLRQQASSQTAFRDLTWMTQERLLNQTDLDAVLIETTPKECLAVAEACIQAGKHIHLDKPAGQSLHHFERVLTMAESKRLLVQLGYMYRYNPAVQLLRQMLAEDWLGEVFEVHAVMSKMLDPADRQNLSSYPGGMMFELGCHLIDLIVQLLGEPYKVSAHRQHVSDQADSLLDNMLAVLEYPKALATVKSAAQEVEGFSRRHLVVCGSLGTFHIQPLDNPSVRLALSQTRGNYQPGYQDLALPKYTRYVADADDMAKIIRGEKMSNFSYQHDLQVQRTVLRACGLTS